MLTGYKTWAESHFSLIYTFSATPRSLWIRAPHPLQKTGCDPVLIIWQLFSTHTTSWVQTGL